MGMRDCMMCSGCVAKALFIVRLNALGKTFLLNKGFSGAVFNAFIASIEVAPLDAESVTVMLTYTDATLVKLRGDQTDTTSDLSSLAACFLELTVCRRFRNARIP